MYYVYIYLDPRSRGKYSYDGVGCSFIYEPFYLGKGKRSRMTHHLRRVRKGYCTDNKILTSKLTKILLSGREPFIQKVKEFSSEKEAFKYEMLLIKSIGRKHLGTGPLVNLTAGGDGLTDPDKSIAAKISKAHLGKKLSEEHKAKIKESNLGVKRSDETKKAISNALVGRQFNALWKERISKSLSGKALSEKHKIALTTSRQGEKNHQWKNIDVARIIKLRESGLTIDAIASDLGVSRTTIKRKLKNEKANSNVG